MDLMTGKKLTPQQAFEKAGLTYSVKDAECERLWKRAERNRKREEPVRAKYHNLKSSFTTAAPPHSQPCRRDGGAGVLGGTSS